MRTRFYKKGNYVAIIILMLLASLLFLDTAFAVDATVNSEAQLTAALSAATGTAETPYVIEITGDFNITAAKTVATGKYIKLISSEGSTFTLKRTSANNLFNVQGSLVLENLIVNGNGFNTLNPMVNVAVGGTFTLEQRAILKNAYISTGMPAAGLVVTNQGTFLMKNGEITDNTVKAGSIQGGLIDNAGTFTMSGGKISRNTAEAVFLRGGMVHNRSGAVFTMSGGVIGGEIGDGNTAKITTTPTFEGGVVSNEGTFLMNQTAAIKSNIVADQGIDYGYVKGGAVCNKATFTMADSAEISGMSGDLFYSSIYGAGVYSVGNATTPAVFTMKDYAKISGDQVIVRNGNSTANGGGVYNSTYSQFTMQGSAQISNNLLTLDNNPGISGGSGVWLEGTGSTFTLKENAKICNNAIVSYWGNSYGGGVYNASFAQFTMQGGEISGNSVVSNAAAKGSRGGGVYNAGALFSMSGGTIRMNQTTGSAIKEGGGVYNNGGSFAMSGGRIEANTAPKGSGVYNATTFSMSGNAQVESSNDVYLPATKYISVTGPLTGTAPFATITPAAYTAGTKVVSLDSALNSNTYRSKIAVTIQGVQKWGLKGSGQDLQLATAGDAYLDGVGGNDANDGLTKATAVKSFAQAKSLLGEVGTIWICGTVEVSGETWSLSNGQSIQRYKHPSDSSGDFTGVLVQVSGGLTLQNILMDGGYDTSSGSGVTAQSELIHVSSGSTLTLNNGTVLCNNHRTDDTLGGAVVNEGTLNLNGGTIGLENSVYLASDTFITIKELYNTFIPIAKIVPAIYPDFGASVKVATANYSGATGADIANLLFIADNAFAFAVDEPDLNLVKKKIDTTITLVDAQAPYTTSEVPYGAAITKPSDLLDSDLHIYYKAQGADDSTYTAAKPVTAGVYNVKAEISNHLKYNDTVSNVITFTIYLLDTDHDGLDNTVDTDDDGDGVPDISDVFPLDPSENTDTDLDGIGNHADTDDDGDGVLDINDSFPLDPSENTDTDLDGIGNHADMDDDGDGVPDINDSFPLDPTQWTAPSSGLGGATAPIQSSTPLLVLVKTTNDGKLTSSSNIPGMYNSATFTVSADISATLAQTIITDALKAKTNGKKAVASVVFGTVANAQAFEVEIPRAEFRQMADTKMTLEVNSGMGIITLGTKELTSIGRSAATGNISLGIKKADKSALSAKTQAKVGNSTLYRFDVSVGNTRISSVSGSVKVTLPYTLKVGEKKKTATIFYVDSKGTLRSATGRYDAKTKMVSLSISRL